MFGRQGRKTRISGVKRQTMTGLEPSGKTFSWTVGVVPMVRGDGLVARSAVQILHTGASRQTQFCLGRSSSRHPGQSPFFSPIKLPFTLRV